MPRAFLLDDEPEFVSTARQALTTLANRPIDLVVATTLEEAANILTASEPGSLFPLLFDLQVPRDGSKALDPSRDRLNGVEALRLAWRSGHRQGLAVVSTFTDNEGLEAKARCDADGIEVDRWLSKEHDLVEFLDWKAHFAPWMEDLSSLERALETHAGYLIIDEVQRRFLASIVTFVRGTIANNTAALPAILLHGPYGQGKTEFAMHALPVIKTWVLNEDRHLDTTRDGRTQRHLFAYDALPRSSQSLSELSEFTDADARIKLFGAKNWTPRKGPNLNEDGIFVAATHYSGSPERPLVLKYEPHELRVSRLESGICFADELLSTSPAVQDLLLTTLSRGTVSPVGVSNRTYPVGCIFASATNRALVTADGQGASRYTLSNALESRFVKVRHPSMTEWTFESVLRFFEAMGTPVAPIAQARLEALHDADMLSPRDICKKLLPYAGPRVTDNVLKDVLGEPTTKQNGTSMRSGRPTDASPNARTGASAPRVSKTEAAKPAPTFPVDAETMKQGEALLLDVLATDGAAIERSLVTVSSDPNVGPRLVLALIIASHAALARGACTQKQLDSAFNHHKNHRLRMDLRNLSGKFETVFIGSGSGNTVVMKDLDRWVETYETTRQAPGDEIR